jgi:hypothetical protein
VYLEKMTIDEIMEMIDEKGYGSVEARKIFEEIECNRRLYDRLIDTQGAVEVPNRMANAVVSYYLHRMDELKGALPYDAMGCEFTVPILIMQEFRNSDIVNQMIAFQNDWANLDPEGLKVEIEKFITVRLDPQGIILYMEMLGNQNIMKSQEASMSLWA